MTCQQTVYERYWENQLNSDVEYTYHIEHLQEQLESNISELYPHVDYNIIIDYVQQADLDEPFNSDDFEVHCYELGLIDDDGEWIQNLTETTPPQ